MAGPTRRVLPALAALLLVLAPAGCGGADKKADPAKKAVAACQDKWRAVADSVLGLDQDTDPSALGGRWTSIIAAIDYYTTSDDSAKCDELVEAQRKEIDSLRQLSDKLRPYDMTYQLRNVRAGIDLYLHDPLPTAAQDENGNPITPPSKEAVLRGFKTLTATAALADADMQPGWTQLLSVPLDDTDKLRTAVEDLDALAQASEAWQKCEASLQVLVAAIRAQEGLTPD